MESIKERLKFYTEMVKLGTLITLTIGGGSIGLLFKLDSPLKVLLFIAGLTLTLGFAIFTTTLYKKILDLLEELDRFEKSKEEKSV